MKQVKCSCCGFLGVCYRESELSDSFSDIQEMLAQTRLDVGKWLKSQDAMLSCFRGQDYILVGVTSPTGGIPVSDLHKAVDRPRHCRYYHAYTPGYTPREHLDLQKDKEQRQFLILVTIISAAVGAIVGALATLILRTQ